MSKPVVPFEVQNLIDACYDGIPRVLLPENVNRVAVHRTIWDPQDPVKICKRFQAGGDLAHVTGGENPYHFLLMSDGRICQVERLDSRAAHARRWNSSALAVALCWPTLRKPLPPAMRVSLRRILKPLAIWVGGVDNIFGHDELPGATSDPNKICPGIDMNALRSDLHEEVDGWMYLHNTHEADRLLLDIGVDL